MRIFEIETFGRGGLTHYAFNLSSALAERGHEVTLITAAAYELDGRSVPPGLAIVKVLGRWGAKLGSRGPGFLRRALARLEALADALRVAVRVRRERPDVAHLHSTNPAALAYLTALRWTGVPLVATAHVVTPHERIPLQTPVYRRIHRTPDLVIAHSQADGRRLEDEFALAQESVEVIPHGEYGFFERGGRTVDRREARRRLGLAEAEEVVLFFGYIREYKGLDLLLDAWPAIQQRRAAARMLIAGDPVRLSSARRQELEEQAEALGAVHRFAYIPFADVATYFAAADLLVMPYRSISQSGVLYLALSVGLPVVATRVGALPELLYHGESALLVPPECPGELAEALTAALGDPELLQRLARGGRRLAREHSWPAIAETTEAAFRHLTGARR